MSREEVRAFCDEYMALLLKYGHARKDAPPGARPMALRFFALPQPDRPAPGPAPRASGPGQPEDERDG